MSALAEAVKAFNKWEFHKLEDEKYGNKTPLADVHVDMWIEAYMLGYMNGVKSQYVPKEAQT